MILDQTLEAKKINIRRVTNRFSSGRLWLLFQQKAHTNLQVYAQFCNQLYTHNAAAINYEGDLVGSWMRSPGRMI